MRLPEAFLTDEEFAAMGWGLKESVDNPDDIPQMRVQPSPAQITRHLDALEWPMRFLCPANVGSARMLGLWAACKVFKRPFSKAIDGRGISRPAANQLRDRGLSLISQGLTRDGVSLMPD